MRIRPWLVLTFNALTELCDVSDLVTFRLHAPPSRLSDEFGGEVPTQFADLGSITVDLTAPVVTCPSGSTGLIISELMDGTWPNGLPKFVEITNCGNMSVDLSNYSLGNINNGAATMDFDALVLSGSLSASDSYVVSYEYGDSPGHSTFFDVYGFDADNLDQGSYINGDDVLVLFDGPAFDGDPADGSGAPVVDVYGVAGVSGVGQPWEYTDGYSNRKAYVTVGNGGAFAAGEWNFGGANSLEGVDDTEEQMLMLTNTTPRRPYL